MLEEGREYFATIRWALGPLVTGSDHGAFAFTCTQRLGAGSVGTSWLVRGGDGTAAVLKVPNIDELRAQLGEEFVQYALPLLQRDEVTVLKQIGGCDGVAGFRALLELELGGRDLPAILMDFKPGTELANVLDQSTLTTREAVDLGARLYDVVHELQNLSVDGVRHVVIHGDINPRNIIIPEGPGGYARAALIDFGFARVVQQRTDGARDVTRLTLSGGQPGYYPRKHWRLPASDPDSAGRGSTSSSDVFAVAVTLYYGLTGRHPWPMGDLLRDDLSGDERAHRLEARMQSRQPAPVRLTTPFWDPRGWIHTWRWNNFFREVLANGDPERIPDAAKTRELLITVGASTAPPFVALAIVAAVLIAGAVLCVLGFRFAYEDGRYRAKVVNVDTDESHCGDDQTHCAEGQQCHRGKCLCANGTTLCGNRCVDFSNDKSNCGACGARCQSGVCESGACSCPGGQTWCPSAGQCVNLSNDHDHCGRCDTRCPLPKVCREGDCRPPENCPGGWVEDSRVCRGEHRADNDNCYGNGACAPDKVCRDGSCQLVCPASQQLCGTVCIDTLADARNCGECGRACRAGEVCTRGSCACPVGMTFVADQCRDTRTDPEHCGTNAIRCETWQRCDGGICSRNCAAGETLCEVRPQGTAPRCVNVRNDPEHCGQCSLACATGQRCVNSRCERSCAAGEMACPRDDVPAQAICAVVAVDPRNCGGCGQQCPSNATCTNGACHCPGGFAVCSGACVDLTRDVSHCGSCGNHCAAHQTCARSACVPVCPDGYTRCGGQCHDLLTERDHCGSCTQSCRDGESCQGGTCTCPAGQRRCADGACHDPQSDDNHCGECERRCPDNATCQRGACQCNTNLTYCSDTCVSVMSNTRHCGRCGNNCATGQNCEQGDCVGPS